MAKAHRGKRGSGRAKKQNIYDQALAENTIEFTQYLDWIASLALSRFVYSGLPDSCDAEYLEQCLLFDGHATIAHLPDDPSTWLSVAASGAHGLTAYGKPVEWQALAANGSTFDVSWDTGTYIFDRKSRTCFWPKLEGCAHRLARYSRTENVNLIHQFTPFLVTAPEDKILDLQNVFAQTISGQVAILGLDALAEVVSNGVTTVDTQVEWIGDKLQSGALGVWSEVFRILGIPHLQFEKRERMITDEAQTTMGPTRLMLDDCLEARRAGVEWINKLFGLNIQVEINPIIAEMFNQIATGGGADDDLESA